jgi:hypothetical protein
MQGTMRIPAYDVFLVFQDVTPRLPQLHKIAAAMQSETSSARLVGVDLYYRADSDVMLLAMRLDARTATQALVGRIAADAERAGAAVLETPRLGDEDRRRFYGTYLAQYPLRVTDLPTAGDAIRVLARDLGQPSSFPDASSPPVPIPFEVRFRRGDEWQLGRLRGLTREGIFVSTGAPPRPGDVVEVNVTAGGQSVSLRSAVIHVTPPDAASAVGASGFAARFVAAEAEDRGRLDGLLQAARGLKLAELAPAPCRRDVRYPVRWPVAVATDDARSRLAALDVSRHGLFLACAAPLPASLAVEVPIDDDGTPVRARARIARVVSEEVARARGVPIGYGVELAGLSTSDDARFHMFVGRIGRRAQRSLLVGAPVDRVTDIVTSLTSAGYSVASATDVGQVAARLGAATPDLVLIDEALERQDSRAARALRRVVMSKSVTLVHLEHGDAPRAARALVDAALLS